MLYNKRQFSKTNDKKVLHKVGKNWMAISLATLMAIGGFTAVKNVSAHAATNTGNTDASNTNTLKERLNASLEKTNSNQNQSNTQASAQKNAQPKVSTQAINNQANALHNRILANATHTTNNNEQNTTNNGQGRITNSGNNANHALSNRIMNTAEPNLGGPNSPQGPNRPNSPQGPNRPNQPNQNSTDQSYSDVPVTVAYANSNGTIQQHLNASGVISDNISESNVTVSGASGATVAASSSFDSSNYSLATSNNLSANIVSGSVNWSNNGSSFYDYSSGVSNLGSALSAGTTNSYGWANWDSANDRPMIVYVPKNSSADTMNINYVDETGHKVGSVTLNSSALQNDFNGAEYGDLVNVWDNTSANSNVAEFTSNNAQGSSSNYNSNADWMINSNAATEGNDKGYYQITNNGKSDNITIPVTGKFTHDTSASNKSNKVHVTFNFFDHNGVKSTASDNIYMNSQNGDGQLGEYYSINQARFSAGSPYANDKVTITDANGSKSQSAVSISSLVANYTSPISNAANDIYLSAAGQDNGSASDSAVASVGLISNGSVTNSSNVTLNFSAANNYSPSVAHINVQYINQNGVYLGTNGYALNDASPKSASNAGTIDAAASDYGKQINITSNSQVTTASGKNVNSNGIAVPAGYHLNSDQANKDAINQNVSDNDKTIQLFVTGDPIKQNIVIHPTVNKDGSTSTKSDFTIQVKGHVGDQQELYANKYLSDLDGIDGVNKSDSKITHDSTLLTFKPVFNSKSQYMGNGIYSNNAKDVGANASNSAYLLTDDTNPADNAISEKIENGKSVFTGYNPITNFTYNVTSKKALNMSKTFTNTIKYVSVSDLDRGAGQSINPSDLVNGKYGIDWANGEITNSDGQTIRKFNNQSNFLTTISTAGKPTDTFDKNAYEDNVPEGYQIVKLLSSSNDNKLLDNYGGHVTPGNDGSSDAYQDGQEVFEVIPNASNITFNYYDQNGKKIKSVTANGNAHQGGSTQYLTKPVKRGTYYVDSGDPTRVEKYVTNSGQTISNNDTANAIGFKLPIGESFNNNLKNKGDKWEAQSDIKQPGILQNYSGSALNDDAYGDGSYTTNYGKSITSSDIDNSVNPSDSAYLGVPTGYSIANVQDFSNNSGVNPYSDPNPSQAGAYSDAADNATHDGRYSNQNGKWQHGITFGRDPQTVNVMMVGNQLSNKNASDEEHITIHELDPNSDQTNQYSFSDVVPGRIGDSFTLDGNAFTPGGYRLTSDYQGTNEPTSVSETINQGGITPNHADFFYKQNVDTNVNDLKPIDVYFQDGNSIVKSEHLYAVNNNKNFSGKSVNVSDYSDVTTQSDHAADSPSSNVLSGYNNPPQGYQIVAHQNMNTNLSTSVEPQVYVQVYNPSEEDSGVIRIQKNLSYSDASGNHTKTVYSDVALTGKKGTNTKLNPSDYQVDGYSVDGDDQSNQIDFGKNGDVSLDSDKANVPNADNTAPNQIDWKYDAHNSSNTPSNQPSNPNRPGQGPKTSDVQPIYVKFFQGSGTSDPITINSNGSVNQNKSDDYRVNGEMDSTVSDIAKAAMTVAGDTKSDLPTNYHFIGNPNLQYTFSTRKQQVDLHVNPTTPSDGTQNVTVHFEKADGTSDGSPKSLNYTISDNAAATITPSDYRPAGYVDDDARTAQTSQAYPSIATGNGAEGTKTRSISDTKNYIADNPYDVVNDNGTLHFQNNFGNGNALTSDGTINYYYKLDTNNNVGTQPIVINYYNKQGQRLNSNPNIIKGYMGQNFSNVETVPGAYTNNVPKGYQKDGGAPNIVENQNLNYTIGNIPQHVDLLVKGQQVTNGKYRVIVHDPKNPSGTPVSDNKPYTIGSDFKVSPNDVAPSDGKGGKYSVVPSSQQPSNVSDTVAAGEDKDNNPTFNPKSGTINYYYYQAPKNKKSDTDPVTVKYVDPDNHQTIESGIISGIGQRGKTISDVSKKVTFSNSNYSIVPGQNMSYTFNPTSATGYGLINPIKVVKVLGKQVNPQFTVHIVKIDRQNHMTYSDKTVKVSDIPAAGQKYRVGNTVDVDAADFPQAGYTPSGNNHTYHVTINSDSTTPNDGTFFYNQNTNNYSGDIVLRYMNQNGQFVNSDGTIAKPGDGKKGITGYQLNSDGENGHQLYGQQVDAIDNNPQDPYPANGSDQTHGVNVPEGYTLDQGQQTNYTFDANNHDITLMIHGDPVAPSDNNSQNQLTINLHTTKRIYHSDTHQFSDHSDVHTIHEYVNSDLQPGLRRGDTYIVNPSKFTPNGFSVKPGTGTINGNKNTNMNDKAVPVLINQDGSITPQTVNFNYDSVNNRAGDLTVKFVNQAGNQVGYSDKISGNIGSDVKNLLSDSDGGEPLPNGYDLNSDQKTTNYQLGQNPQTVVLGVHGSDVQNKLKINQVITHSNGTVTVQSVDPATLPSTPVGNTYEVDPADYMPDGKPDSSSQYDVDYSRAGVQDVLIQPGSSTYAVTPQEEVDGSHNNTKFTHTITFYYNDKTVNAAPVTVRFMNQNGQIVGSPTTITGNQGDQVKAQLTGITAGNNALQTTPNKINGSLRPGNDQNDSANVPNGYTLAAGQSSAVTFSNSPQTLTLNVVGNTVHPTFQLNVVTQDSDSSNGNVKTKTTPVTVHTQLRIGDNFKVSPYSFDVNANADNPNSFGITSISDASGKAAGSVNEFKSVAKTVKDRGNTKTINIPNSYQVPAGYYAENQDSDLNGVVGSDGKLAPASDVSYTYKRTYGQTKLGHIVVHYITSDSNATDINGQQVSDTLLNGKKYRQVDQESDTGIVNSDGQGVVGSNFDLTPYANDIPEQLASAFYTTAAAGKGSDSPVMDKNGNQISSQYFNSAKNATNSLYNPQNRAFPEPAPVYLDKNGNQTSDASQAAPSEKGGPEYALKDSSKGTGDKKDPNIKTNPGTTDYYVLVKQNSGPIVVD